MKLYLSTTSPYSRLALIAALHSGKRDLQLHYVLPWENPAELIAINPYSQIPALLCDDGNILSETLIIMNYLDVPAPVPPTASPPSTRRCAPLRSTCTNRRTASRIRTLRAAARHSPAPCRTRHNSNRNRTTGDTSSSVTA